MVCTLLMIKVISNRMYDVGNVKLTQSFFTPSIHNAQIL